MGRERRLQSLVLGIAYAIAGCTGHETETTKEVRIEFIGTTLSTKASDPDENKITDISLIVFDEEGDAEDFVWLDDGRTSCSLEMIVGKEYRFCACANFGYQVYADHMDELEEIRYHLAYPDEYREGIPMYACETVRLAEGDEEVTVHLKRLMAKISLQMDRSHLSEGVEMYVRSARIGNCPRSASVFTASRIRNEDDRFPAGFHRGELETDGLNRTGDDGLSLPVSLYMLENMQGDLNPGIDDDNDKVFDEDDPRRFTCSFIELETDYLSDRYISSGKGLIYRFYLGESISNLDVERNCHYHIIVTPEDDGLAYDGWRVDKSNLEEIQPVSFRAYPSGYIRGDIGDTIHIWCEFTPDDAPFDVGVSYMEEDKAEGIYDYEIDEDGHGATLKLTGPGRGLIYMEAGEPINDAALFIIEVNMP